MKEKIYEEYGYKIDYLIYKKNHILFELNDSKYMILKTNLSNERLLILNNIVNYLDNYAIFFHQIVTGKKGFIFDFGNEHYVILRLRIVSERTINIDEILRLSNISINVDFDNSIEEKIDFIEKYLANYDLDLGNINYFIGLSENAIALFNMINVGKNFIGHKRVNYMEKAVDFYNPLNIVLDYKTRDLAEYSKSLFMNGQDRIIDNLRFLDYPDWLSYFARVMFPSYYFDMVDQYIESGTLMDNKKISNLANSFEKVLKELYKTISLNINIPYIGWLNNINNF